MNRNDFIKELQRRLRYLPKEDRDDAIAYYNEYLDDMELDQNEDVSAKLGNPKDVAREIIENCTAKAVESQKENNSIKGSGKLVWLVILAIASLPVSLPLAIAAVAIATALLAVVFSILISLFAVAIGIVFIGIVWLVLSFATPGFANKIATFGLAAVILGIGIFATMGMIELSKLVVRSIGKLFVKRNKGDN